MARGEHGHQVRGTEWASLAATAVAGEHPGGLLAGRVRLADEFDPEARRGGRRGGAAGVVELGPPRVAGGYTENRTPAGLDYRRWTDRDRESWPAPSREEPWQHPPQNRPDSLRTPVGLAFTPGPPPGMAAPGARGRVPGLSGRRAPAARCARGGPR